MLGSPPRMRGKPYLFPFVCFYCGITPADAGKTSFIRSPLRKTGDHPRGCGENLSLSGYLYYTTGSPPRMRGKPLCGKIQTKRARITPADAGKTARLKAMQGQLRGSPPRMRGKLGVAAAPSDTAQDHPRGCGENVPTDVLRRM